MSSFKAFRIHKTESGVDARFDQISIDDLTQGEVIIKVAYTCINYKDALAATGKGAILRTYPLVGGIDLSGTVVESSDPEFKAGDEVVVCGANLSETEDGGYAEFARVKKAAVVPLPEGITLKSAMAIGTAGFTAALAIIRMEQNGQDSGMGPIIVTGATGGVGSMAIDMLSAKGYEVIAFSGKDEQTDYLKSLGAKDVLSRTQQDFGKRPMEKAQWAGAIDSVGGETLTWLIRTMKPWGNIASIGLAGGYKLNTTVMPFILRGVSLLGINSVLLSAQQRRDVWRRIANDLKPQHLDIIVSHESTLDEISDLFDQYIDGTITGRTVITVDQRN